MNVLSKNAARVLGVLVEKAMTTPAQYPMTLNGIIGGCNQKSNRLPVLTLNEDQVLAALDELRGQDIVHEVMLSGSRVAKYKHRMRDIFEIGTSEIVVLTELILRGPQTIGEIRGRASRMHPLENLEIVENILQHLMKREQPLVQPVAPSPGSRAGRFGQLIADAPKFDAAPAAPAAHADQVAIPQPNAAVADDETKREIAALTARVESLESEVARLNAVISQSGTSRPGFS